MSEDMNDIPIGEAAFDAPFGNNFDDEDFKAKDNDSVPRSVIIGLIATVVIVAAIVAGFFYFTRDKDSSPQSLDNAMSEEFLPQSGELSPEDEQLAIDNSLPPAFRRAVSPERKAEVEAMYDKEFVESLDETLNPLVAEPMGVVPYGVAVPQEWKDTYGNDWQTLITGSLMRLAGLWEDPAFHGPAFEGDVQAKMDMVYNSTDGDYFMNRLAPLSGIEWAGSTEKLPASPEDYEYYNALVPVLDNEGKVPGTDFKPSSTEWTTSIVNVEILGANFDNEAAYAVNPRIKIKRAVHYNGGEVVAIQEIIYYVVNINGEWLIAQAEYGPVSI